jgi:hypothetical protein
MIHIVKKSIPKPKQKKIRISARPLLALPNIKNRCSQPFTEQSRAIAKSARLEDWGERLRCTCGAIVGAENSNMGDYLVPTPHSVHKDERPPARKRDAYRK